MDVSSENNAVMYAGPGDYSTLVDATFNSLTITPAADSTYQIEYLSYGYGEQASFVSGEGYAPTTGSWTAIGDTTA